MTGLNDVANGSWFTDYGLLDVQIWIPVIITCGEKWNTELHEKCMFFAQAER